jgi:hypothetical protein
LDIFNFFLRSNSSASSENEDRTSYKVSSDTEEDKDDNVGNANDEEMSKAAVVLQSHMKGMLVRKQMKEKKAHGLKKQSR